MLVVHLLFDCTHEGFYNQVEAVEKIQTEIGHFSRFAFSRILDFFFSKLNFSEWRKLYRFEFIIYLFPFCILLSIEQQDERVELPLNKRI